jgi:uncharacterized protein (TIGR02996 family)
MTDTEAALLRAIAAMPEEDTPRLVYADYLDELGESSAAARAEFIRLHVRAGRLHYSDPAREPLFRRIDQILCEWDLIWQREMPRGFKTLSGYRRGFAYRAAADASAIEGAGDDPRTLFIEHLELNADLFATMLRAVVRHPLFAQLSELVVRGELPIGWSGAKTLAEGEYPRLERLVLARQAVGDVGLRYLCNSWGFMRLRELDLSHNDITDDGAAALLRSNLIHRLQRLDLWGNPISPAVMDRVRGGRREW